jgi:hypothetical protein
MIDVGDRPWTKVSFHELRLVLSPAGKVDRNGEAVVSIEHMPCRLAVGRRTTTMAGQDQGSGGSRAQKYSNGATHRQPNQTSPYPLTSPSDLTDRSCRSLRIQKVRGSSPFGRARSNSADLRKRSPGVDLDASTVEPWCSDGARPTRTLSCGIRPAAYRPTSTDPDLGRRCRPRTQAARDLLISCLACRSKDRPAACGRPM